MSGYSEEYLDLGTYDFEKYVLDVLRYVDLCKILEDWRETMAEVNCILCSKSATMFQ